MKAFRIIAIWQWLIRIVKARLHQLKDRLLLPIALLCLLILTSLSLQAGLPPEIKTPLNTSRIASILKPFEELPQKFSLIRKEAAFISTLAQTSADLQKLGDDPCCYFSTALFMQFEEGFPRPRESVIEFPGAITSSGTIHDLLSEGLDKPMITNLDINPTHDAVTINEWLLQSLEENEHALLGFDIQLTHPNFTGIEAGHTVNAIKLNGEVYIFDQAQEAYDIPALKFFSEGVPDHPRQGWLVSGYRVKLDKPVMTTRVLREGRAYQFSLAEVRNHSILVNQRRLDLSKVSPQELSAGLDSDQLRANADQVRPVAACAN